MTVSYAICITSCSSISSMFTFTVHKGQLVKIKERHENKVYEIEVSDKIQVQNLMLFCGNKFSSENFIDIDSNLYDFCYPIKNLEERLEFVFNEKLWKFISTLAKNDSCFFKYENVHNNQSTIKCVVKYIGTIEELDTGRFIGLQYLGCNWDKTDNMDLVQKYCGCDSSRGCIVTANQIVLPDLIKDDVKEIFMTNKLLHRDMVKIDSEEDNFHRNKFTEFQNNNKKQIIDEMPQECTESYATNFMKTTENNSNNNIQCSIAIKKSPITDLIFKETSENNKNNIPNVFFKTENSPERVKEGAIHLHETSEVNNMNFNEDCIEFEKPKWICQVCTTLNDLPIEECKMCESLKEYISPEEDENMEINNEIFELNNCWICDLCTSLNPYTCNACRLCDNHQPLDIKNVLTDKNWTCTECLHRNAKTDVSCTTCLNQELKKIEEIDRQEEYIIFNVIEFECNDCDRLCKIGDGIDLKNCEHSICKKCLIKRINISLGDCICPIGNCSSFVTKSEIASLISREKFEKLSLNQMNKEQIIYCKNQNCAEWKSFQIDDRRNIFLCTVCGDITLYNISNEENLKKNCNNLVQDFLKEFTNRNDDDIKYDVRQSELITLPNITVIPNEKITECSICVSKINALEGFTLNLCLHSFHKQCLIDYIVKEKIAEIICPFKYDDLCCNRKLRLNEIRSIVPNDNYQEHKNILIKSRLTTNFNIVSCKTNDCEGYWFNDKDEDVYTFRCNYCKMENCLPCQAIHEGLLCQQYQEVIANGITPEVEETINMLMEMVKTGVSMSCPECKIFIIKDEGCDWIKCTNCETEICWITKNYRWGKNGKDDISGGCRCNVNGILCHPNCNYCH